MTSLAGGSTAAGGQTAGGTATPPRTVARHAVGARRRPPRVTDGALPRSADVDPDLVLLRTYEPVLRYTAGELFLPTAVEPYLARCSLWADDGGSRRKRRVEELVPPGELTPDGLAAAGIRHRGRPLYLRFVQEQLSRADVAAWRREDRPRLRGKARFAAVGVLARLIDAFVRLSLLVRGRVPGGLVAAAHRLAAAALAQAGEAPDRGGTVRTAYGRVLRTGGYTVLQYWYFYPFNDWRSTFYGVNDHEADWETISVYLVPGRGRRPGTGVGRRVVARPRGRGPAASLGRPAAAPRGRPPGDLPRGRVALGRLPPGRLRRLRRAARAAPGRRLAAARPPTAAALDRGAGPGRVRDPVRRLRPR